MDWEETVNFKQPDAKRAIQIDSNSIFKIGPSELLSSVSKWGLLQMDRMDGLELDYYVYYAWCFQKIKRKITGPAMDQFDWLIFRSLPLWTT